MSGSLLAGKILFSSLTFAMLSSLQLLLISRSGLGPVRLRVFTRLDALFSVGLLGMLCVGFIELMQTEKSTGVETLRGFALFSEMVLMLLMLFFTIPLAIWFLRSHQLTANDWVSNRPEQFVWAKRLNQMRIVLFLVTIFLTSIR